MLFVIAGGGRECICFFIFLNKSYSSKGVYQGREIKVASDDLSYLSRPRCPCYS